jgi:hypothetical protein
MGWIEWAEKCEGQIFTGDLQETAGVPRNNLLERALGTAQLSLKIAHDRLWLRGSQPSLRRHKTNFDTPN